MFNKRKNLRHPDRNGRVLALGGCGIDILAYVDAHPLPDAKIRTNSEGVLYRGGGNAANTATALARLGVSVSLLSKVGDDVNGSKIVAELTEEGVDMSFIVTKCGMPSPSTIVIVAKQEQSRTCIHTPSSEELLVEDVKPMEPEVWRDVVLLHLDSRHTQAAIYMATQARQRGIPVVLDAEKFRPSIELLFPLCDVLVTSGAFPLTMSQHNTSQTTLVQTTPEIQTLLRKVLSDHCTSASMVICTLGAQGSVVYGKRRTHAATSETQREVTFLRAPFSESVWDTMFLQHVSHDVTRDEIVVSSLNDTTDNLPNYFEVETRTTANSNHKLKYHDTNGNNTDDNNNNTTHNRNLSSNNSNICNTDHNNNSHAINDHNNDAKHGEGEEFFATSAAFPLPPTRIVDTTGAGDAHAAGVCVGIMRQWHLQHVLAFAARVSFHKLQAPGARDGLPNFKTLSEFFQDSWAL
eukprot:m.10968 g.10968  ORF g.10968 m.10968 type:complete len:464 (+) comp8571_c0_seq1:212-1603(+)